jgi:hypothetical protein
VIGGWRKRNNEEPYNFFSLPSIIRMMKSKSMCWGRECSTCGREEEVV